MKTHTHVSSTRVRTQSTSPPGMTTWQCTTKSQKLRGIFDLTVHAEAIFQHGWTTKFHCTLFCAALFNSLVTTHHLYSWRSHFKVKQKTQTLKQKQKKEVSRIRLSHPIHPPPLQSCDTHYVLVWFSVCAEACWWVMCGGCELRGVDGQHAIPSKPLLWCCWLERSCQAWTK